MFEISKQHRSLRWTLRIMALLIIASTANTANAVVMYAIPWGSSPSTDGSIDWSAGNAGFSHAVSFENGTAVNTTYTALDGYGLTGSTTMTFYGTSSASFSGLGGSGSLDAPGRHSGGDQTIGEITQDFFYNGTNGNANLVLDGLSPNTTYRLDLYQSSKYTGRTIDFSFDNTGTADATLDDVDRGNRRISATYTTGTNTSVTLHSDPDSNGDTLHWYAFSNQINPDPRVIASRNDSELNASSTDLLQTNFGSVSSTGIVPTAGSTAVDGTEPVLRDGSTSSSYVDGDLTATNALNGSVLTYTLDTSVNTNGYQIDQIDIFHGWRDDGRDRISDFDIAYSTVDDPNLFVDLLTDGDSGNFASYFGLTSILTDIPGNYLATGVASLQFRFNTIENGYGGISEIDVLGSAVEVAAVPEPSTFALAALGLLGFATFIRRRKQ